MLLRPRHLVLVLPTLLLASACGSSDGSDDAARDNSSTTTPTTASSAPDTESSAPTSPPSTESTPSQPSIPAGTPDCSAVWNTSKKLPNPYRGCADGDTFVKPTTLGCSSGQALVVHDLRYWAVAGGTIRETDNLKKDKRYLSDVQRCRG